MVGRLCSVIDGTDSSRLAECLGLDPGKYNQNLDVDGTHGPESSTRNYASAESGCTSSWEHDSTYVNCSPLRVLPEAWTDVASYCKGDGAAEVKGESLPPQPASHGPGVHPAVLANMAVLQARQHIIRFHNMDVVYDEEALPGRSCRWRDIRLQDFVAVQDPTSGTPSRCVEKTRGLLRRQMTACHLYKQLRCYARAVDADRSAAEPKALAQVKRSFQPAANALEKLVDHCAYKWVSLDMFGIGGNKSSGKSLFAMA